MNAHEIIKNICLPIEANVGSHIRDVAWEMCALANKLGVCVTTDFNDTNVIACPGDEPAAIVAVYDARRNSRSR